MIPINIVFAVYGSRSMEEYIEEALRYLNVNSPSEVLFKGEIINLGETPRYEYFGTCGFLESKNIEQAKLPTNCNAYFLLWELKEGDKPCWNGRTEDPTWGVNRKPTASAPYNTPRWDQQSCDNLPGAVYVITFETYHMIRSVLVNLCNYGWAWKPSQHEYGKTVPEIENAAVFGKKDWCEWKRWCYSQITTQMYADFAKAVYKPPVKEKCAVTITTPGYEISLGKEYIGTSPTTFVLDCITQSLEPAEYECNAVITVKKNGKVIGECSRAKLVFFKVGLGDWGIDEISSSNCIDIFNYIGTPSEMTLSIPLKEVKFLSIPEGATITVD